MGSSKPELDCTKYARGDVVMITSLQTTDEMMTLVCLHGHTGVTAEGGWL